MNRFEIIETSKFDVLTEEEMDEVLGGDGGNACYWVYISCSLTIGSGNGR